MIQLSIIICLTVCNSKSNIKAPTIKLIEQKENTTLNLKFVKGILSIHEDTIGNFWIGSKEEGLCKFDGNNYTYYTTVNGLPSSLIRAIQEDEKGNIWLNTGKGICFLKDTLFTFAFIKGAQNLVQNQTVSL